MLLIVGCVMIYNFYGINPESLTKFAGNPETAKGFGSTTHILLTAYIVAPLLEECIFRLGLSFKRWQIALAAASIPAYILWQHFNSLTIVSTSIYVVTITAIYLLVYCLTSDIYFEKLKKSFYIPLIWLSAIAFGLLHLIAFTNHSLLLLPYMLCVILVPFFAGCAITYYRINLGFWWGVGLHIFNNIPALFILLK